MDVCPWFRLCHPGCEGERDGSFPRPCSRGCDVFGFGFVLTCFGLCSCRLRQCELGGQWVGLAAVTTPLRLRRCGRVAVAASCFYVCERVFVLLWMRVLCVCVVTSMVFRDVCMRYVMFCDRLSGCDLVRGPRP